MKHRVKRLIACSIPISACNLECHYCYISQLNQWEKKLDVGDLDPIKIRKALSANRLGGPCIINLTGKGETLIPERISEVIEKLLEEGHYLEVVTNGTLSNRFREIVKINPELLKNLEFKFSFHYLELREHEWLDRFFDNVELIRNAGCSFTIELMPNDELIPYIDDIKKICLSRVGALCQLTIGRDDNNDRKILTKLPIEQYLETWKTFNSPMFDFKYSVFNVKRKEFCYAGMWTLYIDLITGEARQCYGLLPNQNIYENIEKPLEWRPVGRQCQQPFCYNAHAFMTLGVIPELSTPLYCDIRDRIDSKNNHWLTPSIREAFSIKLCEENKRIEGVSRFYYYLTLPLFIIRIINRRIIKYIRKQNKIVKTKKHGN